MNQQEFEKLAKDAIAQYENSPFRLTKKPMVSVAQRKEFPADFPIPKEYLGRNRWGYHIYLLDAEAMLRYTNRYKQEFELNEIP